MAATGLYAGERWAGVMLVTDNLPWLTLAAASLGVLMLIESYRAFTAKEGDKPATKQDVLDLSGDVVAALAARDLALKKFKEIVSTLPSEPVGAEGAKLTKLPAGANLVEMPDGSFDLALPVRVSATFEGGLAGTLSAGVALGPPPEKSDDD